MSMDQWRVTCEFKSGDVLRAPHKSLTGRAPTGPVLPDKAATNGQENRRRGCT